MMPAIDAKYILAVLGPALLVLGLLRCAGPWRNPIQGRIWLAVGAIFSLVSTWFFYAAR